MRKPVDYGATNQLDIRLEAGAPPMVVTPDLPTLSHAPAEGGVTPVADCRAVLHDVPDRLARRMRSSVITHPHIVDDILAAHGREPFRGERRIVVAMGDPVSARDCDPTVSAEARFV
ncbi:hypothetical protein [Streptosporangium carneum]|uniref:Uncharacterized protein n=1 Tax=Streptosporangium carneum TaxID=47481 RepID=A0A9W6MCY5_9ACTN|nr:hypothetical protein [Streptosporangium carneum]GLK09340.1 hypothetical protein GCM10017600_27460 [Streptosporangium carneum]